MFLNKRLLFFILPIYIIICVLSCFLLGHLGLPFRLFLFLCITVCILLGLLFYFALQPILAPLSAINHLFSTISIFQCGENSVLQELKNIHKASEITNVCDSAETAIKQNIFQEYYIDLLRKQMDVEMLKHQIQPHFLYNTLDSIRGQALIENSAEIADALKALSQYFHYNVQSCDDFVCVSNEIQNIKDYFFIQHFRFGNRYTLILDYDSDDLSILNTAIPKFTLQPIVENSIVHGFSNVLDKPCTITIRLEASENTLTIICSDNGIGIPPQQLKKLQRQLDLPQKPDVKDKTDANPHGIALNNVCQRIKLIFGEQYGLQICSVVGIGTDIYIRLPFCEE